MSDTATVPGMGKVKKQQLYIGGAAVAGIAGYAWWTRGRDSAPAAAVEDPSQAIGAADYAPAPTGSSSVSVDTRDPAAIDTNAQWTSQAIARLSDVGNDPQFAATTLGKFLARQPLTGQEADLVRAAIGMLGPPPVGGPWPIGSALPIPAPAPMGSGIKPPGVWNESHLKHLAHVVHNNGQRDKSGRIVRATTAERAEWGKWAAYFAALRGVAGSGKTLSKHEQHVITFARHSLAA